MAIYFDGFDDKMLSFYSESGRVGMLAYPVANKYVKECDSKSPNFMGFVRNVQGNLVGVQLGGYVECKFTGIAPTPGYCGLIADGSGGVKVDEERRQSSAWSFGQTPPPAWSVLFFNTGGNVRWLMII